MPRVESSKGKFERHKPEIIKEILGTLNHLMKSSLWVSVFL